MPHLDPSNYTIEQLKAFNAKYNVMVDVDELFDTLGSLKAGAENIQKTLKDKNLLNEEKENRKNQLQKAIIEKYKETYKNVVSDLIEQRLKNVKGDDLSLSIGGMTNEFEDIMNNILYKETTMAKTIPLSSIAFGGMNSRDFYGLLGDIEFKTVKEDMLESFEGKSTYDINREVRDNYINKKETYDNYISMAQAIKQKNESRGFWGRFFHPIDSRREKNLLKDLSKKANELFRDKDFEADLKVRKPLNEYYRFQRESMYDVSAKLEEISLDPQIYNQEKTEELSTKFPTKTLTPEQARQKAEEKYKTKIAPKFEAAYKKGEDLSTLRGDMNSVEFEGYKHRFLTEKIEQQKEENYKNNIYPRFKEVYDNNNGDLSSLKEEFKEDFKIMQVKFLKDLKEERSNDLEQIDQIERDFQEVLKDDIDGNLSIDEQLKIGDVLNGTKSFEESYEEPVIENGNEQVL